MSALVVPIVEGHGEIDALPVLLRRFSSECQTAWYPRINPPIRVKAASFLKDMIYFTKYVQLAAAKSLQGNQKGLVLILLDCEDDCPAKLGPRLLQSARSVRSDAEYLVVLAHREYESWFIAAAESLRGCGGLPQDLVAPSDINAIRGAKEWLGRRMPQKYDPLNHQVEFTNRMNFDQASRIDSFRRFREKMLLYFGAVSEGVRFLYTDR